MEYIQKIVLSEVQQPNAAAEMESEGKEGVKVQLRVTHASCIPCPAGTSGGLRQHVFALLIRSTMHLSLLHQQRLSLAQIQSPVVKSYGGPGRQMSRQGQSWKQL